MRFSLFAIILLLIVNLCVDYYIFRICRKRFHAKWLNVGNIAMAVLGFLLVVAIISFPLRSHNDSVFRALTWLMFIFFSIYVPKYIFCIFDWLAKIPCLFKHKRLKILSIAGAVLAVVICLSMWWGALFNRFNVNVKEVDVYIPGLPASFENYRIAQISDFHLGTFGSDPSCPEKIVGTINGLHPDMIVFTGDIVNRHADEIAPFIDTLAKLHASDGQYAVLGNHDYADYYFENTNERRADVDKLADYYSRTSLNLLRDSHIVIHRQADSIALIGVENIGRPPFPAYGSLKAAYPTPGDSVTKILLSHDPAHWLDSIANNQANNIALTLAGHTHAAQMKIGRISPSAVIHRKAWAGLYSDNDSTFKRQLYINIGLGTVGLPMRLGATPEITILTLHRQ